MGIRGICAGCNKLRVLIDNDDPPLWCRACSKLHRAIEKAVDDLYDGISKAEWNHIEAHKRVSKLAQKR